MLFRVVSLPEEELAASAAFHARVLPELLEVLGRLAAAPSPELLTLVFAPADHSHRGWRLAAVQGLAREHAPLRINAVAGDSEAAIAAAARYLDGAEGVTGQLLLLDGNGAGEMLSTTA